ncbi:MAG: 4-alpha-glucanotransferase [Ruminococcaceae bacterium]|nr:4-alpha-glucanotransferase [Oscillospiraceae bacterium]
MSGFICSDEKKRKICFLKRSSGVLMNISSLPGEYGIGTVGKEARKFADFLAEGGFTYWQILPINPLGDANSPYSSDGAFAGNYLYIDPEMLCEVGLISRATLENCKYAGSPYSVDYEFIYKSRMFALEEAFSNASPELLEKAVAFAKENPSVEEYAEFFAVAKANGYIPMGEWDKNKADEKDKMLCIFIQYLFDMQWASFKEYVNSKGIYIIGDMPFYVSLRSADVYNNKELFQLDDQYVPSAVAGVPPDFFSEDGQYWGNPVYNWKEMEKQGFEWWIKRIKNSLKYHDIIRIDHFRAFASYWSIPAGAETAKEGKWVKGPKMKLFKALKAALGELPIIAEDLGEFGEDVEKLLADTAFPGMKIIQFGIGCKEESEHSPHVYPENCVAYTGTHDNDTLLGALFSMDHEDRERAMRYCSAEGVRWDEGGFYAPGCRKIIEVLWRSNARVTILPFQDMCGFGSDTRMNVPGTAEGNWMYRTTEETIENVDIAYYKKINEVFMR